MRFFSFCCILLLILILWPCYNTFGEDDPPNNSINFSYDKIHFTKAEKNWVNQKHVVRARVGMNPPLHFFDGKNKGISVDYFNLIAKIIGFQVEYINGIPWQDALEKVKKHETIDLILTAKNIKERQPFMGFSDDYLLMPWVIFSRTNSQFISSIDDLADRTVAVEKGFAMQDKLIADFPFIRLLVENSSLEALEAVASGGADAYIGNLATSTYLISKHNLSNLKVACPVEFGNHNQAFAVRKDWPELVSLLNKAITAIPPRELSRLRNKWFNVSVDYGISKIVFFKWLFIVIVVSTIFSLFFVRKNRKLRVEIEQRKAAEDALQDSEIKHKTYIENAPLGIFVFDCKGKYIDVNLGACKLLGYTHDELIKLSIIDVSIPEVGTKKFQQLKKEGAVSYEGGLSRKDGSIIDVKFNAVSLRNDQFIAFCADISERKQSEEEKRKLEILLQQAQKMESIGNLAGGIAHDFNNLLYPIIGFSEMLKDDLPPDSPEYESAQEIFNAGKRGGELVKQILAFSRQSDHKLSPVRFQKILTEVLKLTRSSIPSDIEIHHDIQQDCGSVMAEPTQLHQIGMNLITNAYHAVEKAGGTISVQFKETMVDDSELEDSSLQSGQYAMLSVSDNGFGIPRNVINNIFEPYFTTKEKEKGTGLGLAVVYGIVKEHKGDIKVYSEEGKGTTFNVYIPLMKKSTETIVNNSISVLPTGTESLLLVDDEESVVRLEKKMLERLGYRVVVQSSSIDALELFKVNPDYYDLVVTDMTMPNMTGDKLAKEILAVRPDIPVIICTGFSERINQEQAEVIGVSGFLMKPVVKSEMAQMVRKVLDKANIYKVI